MPPDPEMRSPVTGQGDRANSQDRKSTPESTEGRIDLQARSLRRRFALSYYFAATVAPLIWGLPR